MQPTVHYKVAGFFLILAIAFGTMGGKVIYQGRQRSLTVEIRSQDAETIAAVASFISLLTGVRRQSSE